MPRAFPELIRERCAVHLPGVRIPGRRHLEAIAAMSVGERARCPRDVERRRILVEALGQHRIRRRRQSIVEIAAAHQPMNAAAARGGVFTQRIAQAGVVVLAIGDRRQHPVANLLNEFAIGLPGAQPEPDMQQHRQVGDDATVVGLHAIRNGNVEHDVVGVQQAGQQPDLRAQHGDKQRVPFAPARLNQLPQRRPAHRPAVARAGHPVDLASRCVRMADRRALQLPPPVLGVLALTPELFNLTLETAPERGCCRPMRRRQSQRDAAVGVGHFPLEQIEAGLVRGEMVETDAQEILAVGLDNREPERQLMTQVERLGALGGEHVAGVAARSRLLRSRTATPVTSASTSRNRCRHPRSVPTSRRRSAGCRDDGPHGPEKHSRVERRRQAIEPLHRPGPRTLMEKQPQQPALAAQQGTSSAFENGLDAAPVTSPVS